MKRLTTFLVGALALVALGLMPGVAAARHGRNHGQTRQHQRGRPDKVSGTIATFAGGVLTITDANGNSVSGQVTSRTHIQCEGATATATASRHGDGGSDNSSGDDHGSDNGQPAAKANDSGHANENEANDNAANESEANEAAGQPESNDAPAAQGTQADRSSGHNGCDTSSLKPGVKVNRAQLRGSGTQMVFKQIKLAAQ